MRLGPRGSRQRKNGIDVDATIMVDNGIIRERHVYIRNVRYESNHVGATAPLCHLSSKRTPYLLTGGVYATEELVSTNV